MTLFTIYQDDGIEGCSEPIVTYINAEEAITTLNKLKREWSYDFKILQHEIGVFNSKSIYG